MVREQITALVRVLRKERVFGLILAVLCLIFLGGLGFTLAENGPGNWLSRFGRGAWWALVTLSTVGYGDVVPETGWGRLVGVFVILGGVLSLSLLTATVSSVFVERKFRRGRGLEAIKATRHILILGWHEDGEVLLDHLVKLLPKGDPLVLVNRLPPEQMEALVERYRAHEVLYLWGDFAREDTLLKANVRHAVKAIILADRQPGETSAQVDQRTLFASLTLKGLQPKVRVLAELLLPENRAYLERAGVEEVLLRGQYDSVLMAGAVASPGLFRILTSMLAGDTQSLWSVEIPLRFQGTTVGELARVLRQTHRALLIAVYTEGRALSMEDLLADERSAIDEFIRRKFAETKMTHLFGRPKVECQINPPDGQVLGPRQYAVVLSERRPSL